MTQVQFQSLLQHFHDVCQALLLIVWPVRRLRNTPQQQAHPPTVLLGSVQALLDFALPLLQLQLSSLHVRLPLLNGPHGSFNLSNLIHNNALENLERTFQNCEGASDLGVLVCGSH
uniref:Uncharacterized protein n=1 Tax=Cacopsylla melanoneura TaxID=428564 RepID=A0A8D8SMT3_9HEMI